MQQTDFIPMNHYSCQSCGKTFKIGDNDDKTKKDEKCYKKVSPVCSDYCFLIVVYNILSKCGGEWLLDLGILFKIENIIELSKKELIYEDSREYKKALFSFMKGGIINYQNGI